MPSAASAAESVSNGMLGVASTSVSTFSMITGSRDGVWMK